MQFFPKVASSKQPPEILYHYTSAQGLLGILQSGKLWTTKIRYMNDSSELVSGLKIVAERFKSLAPQYDPDIQMAELDPEDILRQSNVNVCAISFSKNGDLLSQWRAYGDNGTGYAIGFDTKSLQEKLRDDLSPYGYLGQCVYEEHDKNELIDSLITEIRKQVDGHPHSLSDRNREITSVCSLLKDLGYREEEEWRIITRWIGANIDGLQFRPGKSTLIPYFELNLANEKGCLPIREIICGPSAIPELSASSVEMMLFRYGYRPYSRKNWCVVKSSEIPYRSI